MVLEEFDEKLIESIEYTEYTDVYIQENTVMLQI